MIIKKFKYKKYDNIYNMSKNLILFLKTQELDYFYGNDFYNNLDIMHDNIYNKNINEEVVITTEKYGGDSGHSGFSFSLMKHTLKRYHKFVLSQIPEYTDEQLPEYTDEQLPIYNDEYRYESGCFGFLKNIFARR